MKGSSRQGITKAIDEAVEAFESARARDGRADLAAFLPPPEHPFYMGVLCELVRVDLEYSYEEKQARRLEDYQRRFPELFRDRQRLRAIAFEDFRLRQDAGDSPSMEEYRTRYGLDSEADTSILDRRPEHRQPSAPNGQEDDPGPIDPARFKRNSRPTLWERLKEWAHRRPAIASMVMVVTMSAAIIAALAPGLISRQRRIERANALDCLNRLKAQVDEAEFLLLVSDAPRQKIDAGIAICRQAIDAFHARTDSRWLERPPARSLSDADRLKLRRGLSDTFGLVGARARLEGRDSRWSAGGVDRGGGGADRLGRRNIRFGRSVPRLESSIGRIGATGGPRSPGGSLTRRSRQNAARDRPGSAAPDLLLSRSRPGPRIARAG